MIHWMIIKTTGTVDTPNDLFINQVILNFTKWIYKFSEKYSQFFIQILQLEHLIREQDLETILGIILRKTESRSNI